MAITPVHRMIMRDLFQQNMLPRHGALLEIGEANWYGELDPEELAEDIRKFIRDESRGENLIRRLAELIELNSPGLPFDVVKIFYEIFFTPSQMQAIDFGGSPEAHRFDLNDAVELSRRFDVVINHGTAEHIFNIGQVFKTIHDYTVPGGVMIHESPFTGWIEHGFYNLQPTLYFDLAERNQYWVHAMYIEDFENDSVQQVRTREDLYELAEAHKLPENSMLLTVFRKAALDLPFRTPHQAYYRNALSQRGRALWNDLR